MLSLCSLFLDVFSDDLRCHFVTHRSNIVPVSPEFPTPKLLLYLRELPEYLTRRNALHYLHHVSRCVSWRCAHKHMNVIPICRQCINDPFVSLANLFYQLTKTLRYTGPIQQIFPIFYYPHHVVTDVPPSMRPTDGLAHQPTLPHLPPRLKGSTPQEAGFTRNQAFVIEKASRPSFSRTRESSGPSKSWIPAHPPLSRGLAGMTTGLRYESR